MILLGASNVSRGLDTIVDLARSILGAPIDLFAAIGRGRSYGQWSRLLGRSLPGILDCGLWSALRSTPGNAPVYALVTDIGNDIIYGVEPERLVEWIAESTTRLHAFGAKTTVTGLPIERLESIRPVEFALFTRLVLPSNQVTLEHGVEAAKLVQAATRELTARRQVAFVPLAERWYGRFDPVHVPHAKAPEFWRHLLINWSQRSQVTPPELPRRSWRRWWRYTRLNPVHQKRFGRVVETPQPCLRLRDGSTISLF